MTETADVLIIGAGIMGASTAYHLVRRRVGRVVVLERDTICSGSSALASGGIRHQYTQRVGIELTKRSILTYESFREEFGVDPQFRQHGYLILATTAEELETARAMSTLARELGVDVELLTPDDIRRLVPYLMTGDLAGATYSARDGYADPYLCTTAIAARARDLGAAIRQEHEVTGIEIAGGRVRAVSTRHERFEAPIVVIAAGAWSGRLGALSGVAIPVTPRRRHKFVTAPVPRDRIPAATPFIIDRHTGVSLRREGEGILIGGGRPGETDGFDTSVDWSFTPGVMARIVHRAPVLADARLMRGWAGLYEMTPDQMGIISAVPGVAGLHVIAGFSGHGFMHGPIAGQLMAELIVDGTAHTVDVVPLALERFTAPGKDEQTGNRRPAAIETMTFV